MSSVIQGSKFASIAKQSIKFGCVFSSQIQLLPQLTKRTFGHDQVISEGEKEVSNYYGSSNTNGAYQQCWGQDNIHIGYFPHLENTNEKAVDFAEAAQLLTQKMGEISGMTNKSNVIDFGCGMGGPAMDIVSQFNCKVMGMDLTPEHIDACRQRALEREFDTNQLKFIQGSFLDLPKEVRNEEYTHCFSQMAISHVNDNFERVAKSAHSILAKDGVLIWNEFTGNEVSPSEKCQLNFYDRLHFKCLLSDGKFIELLTKCGFDIVHYEMIGHHIGYGYELLEKSSRQGSFKNKDGKTLLADSYKATYETLYSGEIGCNMVVARKR